MWSHLDNSKVSFVNGAALCAEGDVLENIEKLLWTFGENDYIVLDGLGSDFIEILLFQGSILGCKMFDRLVNKFP